MTINSFTLIPACDYIKQFKLEVLSDTSSAVSPALYSKMEQAKATSIVPTIVAFYSEEKDLDKATYGLDVVGDGTVFDYSEPVSASTKNPFHINVVAYLDPGTYNLKSLEQMYSDVATGTSYADLLTYETNTA